MQRRHRASSLTTPLLLAVEILAIALTAPSAIRANPEGKSIVFEKVHREEEDGNAVIIDAATDSDARLEARDSRGILWNGIPSSESCLTLKGEVGRCTSFKECYPYFKIPDLSPLEGWVLGIYDTCSYIRDNGQTSFGICCSNILPVVTPPPDNTDPWRVALDRGALQQRSTVLRWFAHR